MFGMKLVQAGVLTQAQLDEALRQQQTRTDRIGEILVDLGFVPESTVLRFLASEFRTKYISSERLSRAKISPDVLGLIPLDYAERFNLIPVLFDSVKSQLSIVTSEPQNQVALREVHTFTKVREMRVYIGLKEVVVSAIQKHYHGDKLAFQKYQEKREQALLQQPPLPSPPQQVNYQPIGQSQSPTGPQPILQEHYHSNPMSAYSTGPQMQVQPVGGYAPAHQTQNFPSLGERLSHHQKQGQPPLSFASQPPQWPQLPSLYPNSQLSEVALGEASFMENEAWLPFIEFLVASFSKKLPRYQHTWDLGLPLLKRVLKTQLEDVSLRLQVELAYHLLQTHFQESVPCGLEQQTSPSEVPGKQQQMIELVGKFSLPEHTKACLLHFYDRFGQGTEPTGENIPFGARLLSCLLSFEHLLQNQSNRPHLELFGELKKHEGSLFDPSVLQALEVELKRHASHVEGKLPSILVVEPDPSFLQVLEGELLRLNYWVEAVTNLEDASAVCVASRPTIVVLEVDYPTGKSGFDFVEKMAQQGLEFVFLTRRNQSEDVQRGVALGRDYLLKGSEISFLVASIEKHLRQVLQTRNSSSSIPSVAPQHKSEIKGIAGSLEHLGLPELLQVLSQGRRSGKLSVESETHGMGEVFLHQGEVWEAKADGKSGKEAFFFLITWQEGSFGLDPEFVVTERSINMALDTLLLEGLRLFDESSRDGASDGDIDIDALFDEATDFF